MTTFARIVSGRRSKFVVLGVWIAMLVALGPLIGQFESKQRNEPSSFLPADAESVRALELSSQFPSAEGVAAIVVFTREEGLTAEDRATISEIRTELAASPPEGVVTISPARYSDDGDAALFAVQVVAQGDEEVLIDAVESIRETVSSAATDGLEAKVTGPAGYSADASKAFEGINSTLLLATSALVFVLLVLIYRSPIFWVLPLLSVFFAEAMVRGIGALLVDAGVVVNGQTGGILLVLVFGAGTDYALLLTARYREELHRHEDEHEAMKVAVRQAGPGILASAGTVVAALLCLSLASVNSTAGLGPVGAMGVAVAAVAMLTVLPALLLIGGRRAFWPFVPRFDSPEGEEETSARRRGVWGRLGTRIERRHRVVWIATTLALLAVALGTLTLDSNLTTASAFRGEIESVAGQRLLERSFPAGASAPTTIVVTDPARLDAVLAAAEKAPEVVGVGPAETGPAGALFTATLAEDPFSQAGFELVDPLRKQLRAAAGDAVLVGGATAEEADLREAVRADTLFLVPLVLLVVFVILVLLLRAILGPLMLMATVVLSFFAALGLSLLVFEVFADFPGEDPSYPLFAFIFLVALGIDYNIFLMARVREEAAAGMWTKEAMLKGLAVTGGVITSAGIVLAGTFSVLAVLPLVALTQIGITVALGVLLDTFVVRSILVPALTFSLGERTLVALTTRAAVIGSVWGLLLVGLVLASSVMAVLWWVQVRLRDASHVDVAWAALIACSAIVYALVANGDAGHRALAATLASIWGFRLAGFLYVRMRGKEEDGRYQTLRAKWGGNTNRNFFWFFQFQAVFVVFFSLPFALIALDADSAFDPLVWIGVAVWAVGNVGTVVSDRQLARWRANPANAGKTARDGLWSWSRHPNYFFEWVNWCGIALVATTVPWGWLAWLVPAGLLYLLFKVTGVPATEAQALRSRSDYAEYQRTTSVFVPLPPKRT